MKKNRIFTLTLFLAVTLMSCQSVSERYMNNLKRFIEGIEKNATSFSEDDWAKADAKLTQFTGEQFDKVKDQLSPDEKKEVGRLVGRYYKARVVATGERWWDDVTTIMRFLRGLGTGLLEDFGVFEYEEPKAE